MVKKVIARGLIDPMGLTAAALVCAAMVLALAGCATTGAVSAQMPNIIYPQGAEYEEGDSIKPSALRSGSPKAALFRTSGIKIARMSPTPPKAKKYPARLRPSMPRTLWRWAIPGTTGGNLYQDGGQAPDCVTRAAKITIIALKPYQFDLKFNGTLDNGLQEQGQAAVAAVGSPSYVDNARVGRKAIKLSGDNYLQFDTEDDPIGYVRSFTLAFWVNVVSVKGGDPAIFTNKSWSSGGNKGILFKIKNNWISLNNTAVNGSRLADSGGDDIRVAENPVGVWTHIAAVWDKDAGENGQVRYYKNGV